MFEDGDTPFARETLGEPLYKEGPPRGSRRTFNTGRPAEKDPPYSHSQRFVDEEQFPESDRRKRRKASSRFSEEDDAAFRDDDLSKPLSQAGSGKRTSTFRWKEQSELSLDNAPEERAAAEPEDLPASSVRSDWPSAEDDIPWLPADDCDLPSPGLEPEDDMLARQRQAGRVPHAPVRRTMKPGRTFTFRANAPVSPKRSTPDVGLSSSGHAHGHGRGGKALRAPAPAADEVEDGELPQLRQGLDRGRSSKGRDVPPDSAFLTEEEYYLYYCGEGDGGGYKLESELHSLKGPSTARAAKHGRKERTFESPEKKKHTEAPEGHTVAGIGELREKLSKPQRVEMDGWPGRGPLSQRQRWEHGTSALAGREMSPVAEGREDEAGRAHPNPSLSLAPESGAGVQHPSASADYAAAKGLLAPRGSTAASSAIHSRRQGALDDDMERWNGETGKESDEDGEIHDMSLDELANGHLSAETSSFDGVPGAKISMQFAKLKQKAMPKKKSSDGKQDTETKRSREGSIGADAGGTRQGGKNQAEPAASCEKSNLPAWLQPRGCQGAARDSGDPKQQAGQGKHWVSSRVKEYERKEEEVTGLHQERWEEEQQRWKERVKEAGQHAEIREWPIEEDPSHHPLRRRRHRYSVEEEEADKDRVRDERRRERRPMWQRHRDHEAEDVGLEEGHRSRSRSRSRSRGAPDDLEEWEGRRRNREHRSRERHSLDRRSRERAPREGAKGPSSTGLGVEKKGEGEKDAEVDPDAARGAAAAEAAAAAAAKLAAATAAARRVTQAVNGLGALLNVGAAGRPSLVSQAAATEQQDAGEKKRRSRWQGSGGPAGSGMTIKSSSCLSSISTAAATTAAILSAVKLPDFVKDLAGGELNPEVQALNARLNEINRRLQSGSLVEDAPEGERSPSPEPLYNSTGVRVNTREMRAREKLQRERSEVIAELIKKNPNYKPPADYRPPKLYKKLYVPQKDYPGYNFIGLIIGPRGNTQKRMEKDTGTKIVIRGKGSQKEGRALGSQGKPLREFKGLEPADADELHVLIEADNEESLEKAAAMVQKLLVPTDVGHNEHKRQQLLELATINGTVREGEVCHLCGEPGHKQYNCPQQGTVFRAEVSCSVCGDGGHPTSDCPNKGGAGQGDAQAPADEEYKSFLAEVGGGSGPGAAAMPMGLGGFGDTSGPGGLQHQGIGYQGPKPGALVKDDECNLYVGYLPPSVDDQGLYQLFAGFGLVLQAKVIKDRSTGLSRGFGFVLFANKAAAQAAVQAMHGYRIENKTLVVRSSADKGQKPQAQAQVPAPGQPGGLYGPGVYRGPQPGEASGSSAGVQYPSAAEGSAGDQAGGAWAHGAPTEDPQYGGYSGYDASAYGTSDVAYGYTAEGGAVYDYSQYYSQYGAPEGEAYAEGAAPGEDEEPEAPPGAEEETGEAQVIEEDHAPPGMDEGPPGAEAAEGVAFAYPSAAYGGFPVNDSAAMAFMAPPPASTMDSGAEGPPGGVDWAGSGAEAGMSLPGYPEAYPVPEGKDPMGSLDPTAPYAQYAFGAPGPGAGHVDQGSAVEMEN